MKDINITDDVVIYNDMEYGWIAGKYQPSWHKKVYHMWMNMWKRVYNKIYWFGSLIHPSFQYLSNYVKWIESQPNFEDFCKTCNIIRWSVDKDAKYPGNKNYYPDYMTLMTSSENSKEAINRNGSPNPNPKQPLLGLPLYDTKKIILATSTQDVTKYGFDQSAVSKCLNKRHKFHKGYKWLRVYYKHNKKYRIKNNF